jgi:hypothetical protein
MAPFILNLSSRWKLRGLHQALATLPQGNSPLPTKQKARWASEPVWMLQRMVVTRTSGATPPLSHELSWCAQEHL